MESFMLLIPHCIFGIRRQSLLASLEAGPATQHPGGNLRPGGHRQPHLGSAPSTHPEHQPSAGARILNPDP